MKYFRYINRRNRKRLLGLVLAGAMFLSECCSFQAFAAMPGQTSSAGEPAAGKQATTEEQQADNPSGEAYTGSPAKGADNPAAENPAESSTGNPDGENSAQTPGKPTDGNPSEGGGGGQTGGNPSEGGDGSQTGGNPSEDGSGQTGGNPSEDEGGSQTGGNPSEGDGSGQTGENPSEGEGGSQTGENPSEGEGGGQTGENPSEGGSQTGENPAEDEEKPTDENPAEETPTDDSGKEDISGNTVDGGTSEEESDGEEGLEEETESAAGEKSDKEDADRQSEEEQERVKIEQGMTLYSITDGSTAEAAVTASSGNVVIEVQGTAYTDSAEKILKRLNDIRYEACKEGVRNPKTGKPLTMADYVPLMWSADLEAIARLRAAEATVKNDHERPNGKSCFTVETTDGVKSSAENLAWNSGGLMAGIEQWYGEKGDWINKTAGKVTGHYESLINPSYKSVAVAAFSMPGSKYPYTVSQEFSTAESSNVYKNPAKGSCTQKIEAGTENVTELDVKEKRILLERGGSYKLPITLTVQNDISYSGSFAESFEEDKVFTVPSEYEHVTSGVKVVTVDKTGMVKATGQGSAVIVCQVGSITKSVDVSVDEESSLTVTPPTKRTYKVGEKISLAGGKVSLTAGGSASLSSSMVSGFDSGKAGLCSVSVTYKGYVSGFDVLIVETPAVTGSYGRTLEDTALPQVEYGTYSWQDPSQILSKVGVNTYKVDFVPTDTEQFRPVKDLAVKTEVYAEIGKDNIQVSGTNFTYAGAAIRPKTIVAFENSILREEEDYILTYEQNVDVGTATIRMEGAGYYKGKASVQFGIAPAKLTIRAKDKTIVAGSGSKVPSSAEFRYEIEGLMAKDKLLRNPTMKCSVTSKDLKEPGRYDIVPSGADAGKNYMISYEKGALIVAEESVAYTVFFDVAGHGEAPAASPVKAGGLVKEPAVPKVDGYQFGGWYKEAACKNAWNFETDTVKSDITLYAKWLKKGAGDFSIQEISDVIYTGKACKPKVSVYDGDMLLKENKDYKIAYHNNVNANAGGKKAEAVFDESLPYVEITGKGNYTSAVKINFNILPAQIGDGKNLTTGVTLKYSDQLVTNRKKAQNPFKSIKLSRAMKKDKDFTLHLETINVLDENSRVVEPQTALENAVIPKGYSGSFLMKVEGTGNYAGGIQKQVFVTDKGYLMKNAKITLGKKCRNVEFTGEPIVLTPSLENSEDTFTVKCGGRILAYEDDYTVSYRSNNKVGKAELTITGNGRYSGSKTVSFQIKGKAFNAKTVAVEIPEKSYTGKALTQNDVTLIYRKGTKEERTLTYGVDYRTEYAKNINKGTASMTFVGLNEAGFSGSFKKSFKITAADISDTEQVKQSDEMKNISVEYTKAGAQPKEYIKLTNAAGAALKEGRDYTVSYRNNKVATLISVEQDPPTMIIKGKGNYTGKLEVTFTIVQASLNSDKITVSVPETAYNPSKPEDYEYKPKIKVFDGKTLLKAGKDYEIVAYKNNTQKAYEAYLQKLESGSASAADAPMAVIKPVVQDGGYQPLDTRTVLLPIYKEKLTAAKLTVTVEEPTYTRGQAVPRKVTVSYNGEGGQTTLTEGKDYTITYGANNAAGKNKGSVTIRGISPRYGGSVTKKFQINSKTVEW